MNKVNHIKVNYSDYLRYYEKYGHDRLDKWNKIIPKEEKNKMLKELGNFIIEEEIFDGIETYVELLEYKLILLKTTKEKSVNYKIEELEEEIKNLKL